MTPREEDLMNFIYQFISENKYSPSNVEMMIGINTKSKSHINDMLEHLRELGYITFQQRKARTVVIMGAYIPTQTN